MKRKNNKGTNHLKKHMAAMLSSVESAINRNKEKEEAEKLDMEIQTRVSAYKKEYYKDL